MTATRAPALPTAVLWDMDGTLVDTEPFWMQGEWTLAERHGGTWSEEHALNMVGGDLRDSAAYMAAHMGTGLPAEQLLDELLELVIEQVTHDLPWRPGARELLEALREAGVPCALVTASWRRFVEPVVAGLPAGTFEVLVCGDEVPRGKPHPDPYLQAAQLLGVRPQDAVAIEDSPTGAASAEAAGCRVLVVPSHVPVPEGEGRAWRETLSGLAPADLDGLFA